MALGRPDAGCIIGWAVQEGALGIEAGRAGGWSLLALVR